MSSIEKLFRQDHDSPFLDKKKKRKGTEKESKTEPPAKKARQAPSKKRISESMTIVEEDIDASREAETPKKKGKQGTCSLLSFHFFVSKILSCGLVSLSLFFLLRKEKLINVL